MLAKQNWLQLTLIQLGGVICLPMILVGTLLAQRFGLQSALIAILVGNVFLFALGILMVLMTLKNRKTTMENAKEYFGISGGKLFATVMTLSLTGWFAIQLNMISLSLHDLFGLNTTLSNLVVGVMITLTALKGIRSLSLLSDLSAPLLVVTLAYAVWNREEMPYTEIPMSLGAVSIVIAATIAAVVDIPTYYRHAKNEKHALLSIACLFCLIIPLVEVGGVLLATDGNILQTLKGNGGMIMGIWVALFLVLAGWTTNATNLFSNVACLETIFPTLQERMRVVMMGGVGSVLACFDLLTHFEMILEMMGIAVTAMGAVIVVRFVKSDGENTRHNFFAWGMGTALGYLSVFDMLPITTVAQLDAFIIAAGAATLLKGGVSETAYTK